MCGGVGVFLLAPKSTNVSKGRASLAWQGVDIVKLLGFPPPCPPILKLARAEVDAAKDKLAKLEVGGHFREPTDGVAAEHSEAHRMPPSHFKVCLPCALTVQHSRDHLPPRPQGLHAAETSTLQQRLARLTEHLAATQPEVLPVLLGPDYHPGPDPGPAGPHPTHAHPTRMAGQATGGPHHAGAALADMGVLGGPQLLSREAELEKAVEAAETAVAVMQGKLLAALRAAADASEEAARVRREAEWERDRLEAEVRVLRIALLLLAPVYPHPARSTREGCNSVLCLCL